MMSRIFFAVQFHAAVAVAAVAEPGDIATAVVALRAGETSSAVECRPASLPPPLTFAIFEPGDTTTRLLMWWLDEGDVGNDDDELFTFRCVSRAGVDAELLLFCCDEVAAALRSDASTAEMKSVACLERCSMYACARRLCGREPTVGVDDSEDFFATGANSSSLLLLLLSSSSAPTRSCGTSIVVVFADAVVLNCCVGGSGNDEWWCMLRGDAFVLLADLPAAIKCCDGDEFEGSALVCIEKLCGTGCGVRSICQRCTSRVCGLTSMSRSRMSAVGTITAVVPVAPAPAAADDDDARSDATSESSSRRNALRCGDDETWRTGLPRSSLSDVTKERSSESSLPTCDSVLCTRSRFVFGFDIAVVVVVARAAVDVVVELLLLPGSVGNTTTERGFASRLRWNSYSLG